MKRFGGQPADDGGRAGKRSGARQPPQLKPNVVVIMTDDIGWGDLGSYGGGAMRGAPTPNLDQRAAEGMRFVNYYGLASCTAGRASPTSPSAREVSSPSPEEYGRSAMQ